MNTVELAAMNPPGCPRRQVVMVDRPMTGKLRGAGAFLKLECGHWNWEAGFSLPEARFIYRPCLSGCYRHQRPMGIHC